MCGRSATPFAACTTGPSWSAGPTPCGNGKRPGQRLELADPRPAFEPVNARSPLGHRSPSASGSRPPQARRVRGLVRSPRPRRESSRICRERATPASTRPASPHAEPARACALHQPRLPCAAAARTVGLRLIYLCPVPCASFAGTPRIRPTASPTITKCRAPSTLARSTRTATCLRGTMQRGGMPARRAESLLSSHRGYWR